MEEPRARNLQSAPAHSVHPPQPRWRRRAIVLAAAVGGLSAAGAAVVAGRGLARAWASRDGALGDGSGAGRSAAALSGDMLRLEDGREVRLAGLIAPTPPSAPFALNAARGLAALTVGRDLTWTTAAPDRWDRVRALMAFDAPLTVAGVACATVQDASVAAGLARVRPERAARPVMRRLLVLERAARGAGRGLWAYDAYRERAAHSAAAAIGGYHLIVGQAHTVRASRRGMRLHFSANPRADFTVGVSSTAREAVGDAFVAQLPGAWLRVRGFVEPRDGPWIDLTEAHQIEVLAWPGQARP